MAEAEWTALGKNHNHGVRRTQRGQAQGCPDGSRVIEAAAKMSNRKLAEYLEVSHTFVAERAQDARHHELGGVCRRWAARVSATRRPARDHKRQAAAALTPESGPPGGGRIAWARKLLGTDEGKAMLAHCRANAANCKRTGGGWIDNGGEPYKGSADGEQGGTVDSSGHQLQPSTRQGGV